MDPTSANAIHAQAVLALSHGLRALAALLEKARSHATAAGYDVNVLCSARLFPDMFPLTRQVMIATDMAKGAAARLAGVEVPKWEDTETTLEQLQARIAKALSYLASFTPAQYEGAASRAIEIKTPSRSFHFSGQDYLQKWVLPNFYFHTTTAYNLLRHNGVPLGKMDFLAVE